MLLVLVMPEYSIVNLIPLMYGIEMLEEILEPFRTMLPLQYSIVDVSRYISGFHS